MTAVAACLPTLLARYRDRDAEAQRDAARGPALVVAAGVLLGAALIGFAAVTGLPHWQSIPSTWDAVWHANTVRFILDTGQASPTHMGELRNVETHDALYYPSTFHAARRGVQPADRRGAHHRLHAELAGGGGLAVPGQRRDPDLESAAAASSASGRPPAAAATAAALSASFTAIPYVEFDTASMPNLAAYGLAVPTMVLVMSAVRHRDRIPLAVLALLGVFSVHITGGVVTVAVRRRVVAVRRAVASGARQAGRLRRAAARSRCRRCCLLLPQFVGVLQQAEIIAGHAFVTHEGKKRGLIDAVVQHTRHLNDFPIQWVLIAAGRASAR